MTHGERDYPYECCGLLLGSFENGGSKTVSEIYAISNAREEAAKRNRFLIRPEELMRGERYAVKSGLGRVGLLPFTSGSSGRAFAIRSRTCLARLFLHRCFS